MNNHRQWLDQLTLGTLLLSLLSIALPSYGETDAFGPEEKIGYQHFMESEINAPIDVVWGVLSDCSAYPEWNPFILECDTNFEIDSPLKMKVELDMGFPFPQVETITAYTEGEMFEYQFKIPLGAIHSVRQHVLTRIDDNTTHYVSSVKMKGWMMPLVRTMQGKALDKGFPGMANAMIARAEAIAAETIAAENEEQ